MLRALAQVLVMLTLVCGVSVALGFAQVDRDRWTTYEQREIERRLSDLEGLRPDARLSVMENRLDRVEQILYGVLIIAIGQLVLSGLSFKQSRKGG